MKKFPHKLGCYKEYKSISYHLQSAVYDSLTVEDFESKWDKTIDEFGLKENEWLNGLFHERHLWVPIFLKDCFWAGMSTTQRSESMHAFFDGYVSRQTTLRQFVAQYDNALQNKAEKEYEADFRSFSTTIECASNSPIERQFQSTYTHEKYVEIRKEFARKGDCYAKTTNEIGCIKQYSVMEEVMVGDKAKEVNFMVAFDKDQCDVKCECRLFEFRGIVCRHALTVLFLERVHQLPNKYILKRWRKDIKWKHSYIKSSYDIHQLKPQMQRFDLLVKQFDGLAELAAEYVDTTSFIRDLITILKEEVEEMAIDLKKSRSSQIAKATIDEVHEITSSSGGGNNKILSPIKVCRKGRPSSKRKLSVIERLTNKCKKIKKATESLGHKEVIGACLLELDQN